MNEKLECFCPPAYSVFNFLLYSATERSFLLLFFCKIGVEFHSRSQSASFTQAASLQEADKEGEFETSVGGGRDSELKTAKPRSKRGENWTKRQPSCRRNRLVVLPLLDGAKEPTTCQSFYWTDGFQSFSKKPFEFRPFLRCISMPRTNKSQISPSHAGVSTLWANVSGNHGNTMGPNTGFHCCYVSQLIPKTCFCLRGFA